MEESNANEWMEGNYSFFFSYLYSSDENRATASTKKKKHTKNRFSSIIGLNISIDAILNYISQAFFYLTHLCIVECWNTNGAKNGIKITEGNNAE